MGNDIMNDPQQMLTPKTVANLLGVHQKTVHLWLRTGRLHGIKISYRAWRIPRPALEEFLEKNRNVPQRKGTDDTVPAENLPASSVSEEDGSEFAGAKMKEYLRDIMGEQTPDAGP